MNFGLTAQPAQPVQLSFNFDIGKGDEKYKINSIYSKDSNGYI